MSPYFLFPLFLIGLLMKIYDRVRFERRRKGAKTSAYVKLYKENNNLYLLLFLILALRAGGQAWEQFFGQ